MLEAFGLFSVGFFTTRIHVSLAMLWLHDDYETVRWIFQTINMPRSARVAPLKNETYENKVKSNNKTGLSVVHLRFFRFFILFLSENFFIHFANIQIFFAVTLSAKLKRANDTLTKQHLGMLNSPFYDSFSLIFFSFSSALTFLLQKHDQPISLLGSLNERTEENAR